MGAHLQFSEHLTPAPCDIPIRETFLGQAHIAGTGPDEKTCRECRFWHCWARDKHGDLTIPRPPGYYGKRHRVHPLEPKKAFCNKPILNKAARLIPHDAKSCRLFEPADNPMPARRPE